MSELNNLIGCKISLISTEEVRYDGVLFHINAKEAIVVLQDVKCIGTEDRVTDPAKVVLSNDKVTPFLSFSGQDIKDLYVDDSNVPKENELPNPPVAEKPSTLPPSAPSSKEIQNQAPNVNAKSDNRNNFNRNNNDRRSSNQNQDRFSNQRSNPKQSNNRSGTYNDQSKGRGSGRSNNQNHNGNNYQQKDKQQRENKDAPTSSAGTGEHLLKRWEQRPSGASQSTPITNVKEEFDFNAGLTSFNKEALLAEVASSATVPKEPPKYNKLDFFDNISCDQVDRSEGRSTRLTYTEEKKLNQDTFGVSSLRNGYRGRGRGRGGYYNRPRKDNTQASN